MMIYNNRVTLHSRTKLKDMNTKRITFTLISLLLMMTAFAAGQDLANDTTMVPYEETSAVSEAPLIVDDDMDDLDDIDDLDDLSTLKNLDKEDKFYLVVAIGIIVLAITISIILYVLVAVMAKKRNRSVIGWVLLSLLATPVITIIILLVIGKDADPLDRRLGGDQHFNRDQRIDRDQRFDRI